MDYTNMTFGDLLVADIGDLPKHTRINEDIYDLLTLPYTLGSGVRARLLSARLPRNDDGFRYNLKTIITNGDVEAVLETKLTVAGREAAISEYSGTVKMPRHGIELAFTQDDAFQDYLGNVESAILQMDEIANHRDITVVINGANEVTPECVGMLCHMIANIEHNKLPDDPEMRRLMMREKVFVELDGEGTHKVSVLRPDANVDESYVQERYTAVYDSAFNRVEITRERKPNDEKTLRRLVTNGEPLVTSTSQSMCLENANGLNHLTAVRELMKRLHTPERAPDPQGLLDDLAQDEHTL